MIQRIQTLWLLFAAVAALLTFQFTFYSGNIAPGAYSELTALGKTTNIQTENSGSMEQDINFLLLILTVSTAVLSVITIFLFKNRKMQLRLAIVGLLMSIGSLVLFFKETNDFIQGSFNLGGIFSFIVPLFLIMALRGIYKDQKLIKSLDRLR